MAFKLIETPQDRWRAATRPISSPWSAPGATFVNDQLVERPALDAQGDVLSWDIFAQVGAALRNGGGVDPLGGLTAKHVIAAGQSQASERLTAYYNSIQPLCPEIYEGFIGYDRFNRVHHSFGHDSVGQTWAFQLASSS